MANGSKISNDEGGDIDLNSEIGTGITGKLIRLPSYEEINHKDIMSFYVKEFVDDKNIRKNYSIF